MTAVGTISESAAMHHAQAMAAANVIVTFEGLAAIDGVSLKIQQGQVYGLIGPNGAGKTTLVNVLTGFQAPDSGRITVDRSQDITNWPPHRIARFGIARTFQNVRLFKSFTVRENVEANAIGMGLGRRTARTQTAEILDWVGLSDAADVLADTLPYGEERRVGIARALAGEPKFLLLDEPAAGMSEAECDELMDIISRIPAAFSCGVLLIEHNMRVIMELCKQIHVIDFGRTIAEGTPKEIQSHPEVLRAYLGTGLQ